MASIQSLITLGNQKKYEFHFDFGEEENNKILNDSKERENFIKKWKEKISQSLNININNLIFTNLHHGSVGVDVSIMEGTKKDEEALLALQGKNHIKKVEEKPMLEALQLSPDILDPEGDRNQGWGINEKRGGEKYIPPINGWYGIGLKIKDKYDNGDMSWIDYRNNKGEFAIAYLGINNILNEKGKIVEHLNNVSKNITTTINEKLYKDDDDIRTGILNSYLFSSKCGDGVCLFQNPEYAENSAGIIDILGFRIKIILMCRVNSQKIRQPRNCPECWILNPSTNEIRPYRILLKKIPVSPLASSNRIITTISPINYIISAIKSNNISFYNLYDEKRFEKYKKIDEQNITKEQFAIRLYTSNYYGFINEYLRTEKILDTFKGIEGHFSENDIKSWIYCLQLALKNNKNVENNTVVYRGITTFKFPDGIGIGSKFYFREFFSTSLRKKVALSFISNNPKNGTLMIITIKNNGIDGHPNYCFFVKDLSCFKGEEEIIISCHCYFVVDNIIHQNNLDVVYLSCEGYLLDE